MIPLWDFANRQIGLEKHYAYSYSLYFSALNFHVYRTIILSKIRLSSQRIGLNCDFNQINYVLIFNGGKQKINL